MLILLFSEYPTNCINQEKLILFVKIIIKSVDCINEMLIVYAKMS